MPRVNIAIIGSQLIHQIHAGSYKAATFNVVLISRSSKSLISNDYSPINLDNWQSEMSSSNVAAPSVEKVLQFLEKSPLPAILVDNTSNETWAKAYPEFLSKSISVVTPNKKAFSSDIGLWNAMFNKNANDEGKKGLVYHEATVGAGLPIISTLKDLVATGDKILKIEGTFSGSLGFIFSKFSPVGGSDFKFSDIVKAAKQNGYTEPDPREDLNGLDVARKVTILSRLSGFLVEGATSFPVDSLIPKELESIGPASEFMEKLPEFDDHFDKLRKAAYAENKVLRYVGKVDLTGSGTVKVGIEKYDFSHPFANLPDTDNVISFNTERYPANLIVQGSGAGGAVTASGVFADIIKVAERVGA